MDLISKKDLLAQTGISYGQLYRWKREGLIPEDWFIKQSSYTGQETFFPKEQVLERVTSIMKYKDEYSLEEMTKIFSPETSATISTAELRSINEVDDRIIDIVIEATKRERFSLLNVAFLALMTEAAHKTTAIMDNLDAFVKETAPTAFEGDSADTTAIFFSVAGECHAVFVKEGTPLAFDRGTTVLFEKSANDVIGNLKYNYKHLFAAH